LGEVDPIGFVRLIEGDDSHQIRFNERNLDMQWATSVGEADQQKTGGESGQETSWR